MRSILYIISFTLLMSTGCVTGGFDQNEKLDELEATLALAPKVNDIRVNGTELVKDQQSIRDITAGIGEVLNFAVDFQSGNSAQLRDVDIYRQFYDLFQESSPAEDGASDSVVPLTGASDSYEFQVTVPAQDPDGSDLHDGDHIWISFLVSNSSNFLGYKSVRITIVE